MRTARAVAGLAVGIGVALLAYAALQGDVSVHLVLVVPVVTASGPVAALGALSALGGLIAWLWVGIADAFQASRGPAERPPRAPDGPERASESSSRGGGVLLLGPIPIAWGTEKGSLLAVIVAATVLVLVALAASLLLA